MWWLVVRRSGGRRSRSDLDGRQCHLRERRGGRKTWADRGTDGSSKIRRGHRRRDKDRCREEGAICKRETKRATRLMVESDDLVSCRAGRRAVSSPTRLSRSDVDLSFESQSGFLGAVRVSGRRSKHAIRQAGHWQGLCVCVCVLMLDRRKEKSSARKGRAGA